MTTVNKIPRYTKYGTIRDKFVDLLINERRTVLSRSDIARLAAKAGSRTDAGANYFASALVYSGLVEQTSDGQWKLPDNRQALAQFNTTRKS